MDIWSSLSIRQFNSLITAFQILIRRVSRPDISNSRLTAIQVFAVQAANKQTQTFGQLLTLGTIVAPSTKFTGPVDVVLGQNDLVFCGGDCTKPQDQSALVVPAFYPAAGPSQNYIAPGAGHVIFAHYSAQKTFSQMIDFLKTNKL